MIRTLGETVGASGFPLYAHVAAPPCPWPGNWIEPTRQQNGHTTETPQGPAQSAACQNVHGT